MPDETPTGEETTDESSVIKQLRKQLADATKERDELKAGARQRAFADAGITEAGRNAMDRLYDGDLDADAIRAFAADNGITVTTDTATAETAAAPVEVPAAEQERRDAQARIGQLGAVASTPPPADAASELKAQITAAEEAGDLKTAIRLKSEQAMQLRRVGA